MFELVGPWKKLELRAGQGTTENRRPGLMTFGCLGPIWKSLVELDHSELSVKMWDEIACMWFAVDWSCCKKLEVAQMAVVVAEEEIQITTDVVVLPRMTEHTEQTILSSLVHLAARELHGFDIRHFCRIGRSDQLGIVDNYHEDLGENDRSGMSDSCPGLVVSGRYIGWDNCMIDGFANCE